MKQEHTMKKCNEQIEAEVTRSMKLLDEMETVKVSNLFRVRLMQRIEREYKERAGGERRHFGNRLDFRLAVMATLLIVNLGSALLSLSGGGQKATTTISELLDNQSDDYSSQDFAYYDQTTLSSAETTGIDNRTP